MSNAPRSLAPCDHDECGLTKCRLDGGSDQRLVRAPFVERMESELQANAHKGDWRQWKPTALQVLSELQHHEAKLTQALAIGDCEHVREFAADIANIAMKIDEQFGGPNESSSATAALGQQTQPKAANRRSLQ